MQSSPSRPPLSRLGSLPVLALALLISPLQASAARAVPVPTTTSTIAILAAQADRWDKAIVRKDRAAIAANMAEDFRQIDGGRNVETKASYVEDLLSPKLVIAPYKVEDFDVRLYGDVALLSGRTRMTGSYDGKPFQSHYRYIDIYVRRGGVWKIVSVQISKIPD